MVDDDVENNDILFSLVLPCYNEEDELPGYIPSIFQSLESCDFKYEMILVDNGSKDKTGEIIDSFIEKGYPVKKISFKKNVGYGGAIRSGMRVARGKYISHLCSDGQISAEDVTKLLKLSKNMARGTISKVSRASRGDGFFRKIISTSFNSLFTLTYGDLTSDVNGVPKVIHRDDLKMLDLQVNDGFLEAELMIKAIYLRFNILAQPTDFLPRSKSKSKINVFFYSLMFIKNILKYKYTSFIEEWKQRMKVDHNI